MIMGKFPSIDRINKGPVAVVECYRQIPCNPCQTACKFNAITVGDDINNIPEVNTDNCTGCAICVSKCPGLAIFMVQEKDEYSLVGIPYELLPIPDNGMKVKLLDREGKDVADGEVDHVVLNNKGKTHVVFLRVPKGYEDVVRSFRILAKSEEFICRCEEITKEDIERVIDMGITDYEELRRVLRIGMGPCGGKTCRTLTLQILSEKTGRPISEIELGATAPQQCQLHLKLWLSPY